MNKILPILNGLLTPAIGILTIVIAFIAVYIAFQQKRISKAQYRLNLFEKRYAVFEATRHFLQDILKHGKIIDSSGEKFWLGVTDAEFLFEDDVVDFLTELRDKATEQLQTQARLFGPDRLPKGEERTGVSKENIDLIAWFIGQRGELVERFSKYLKCDK